MKDQSSYTYAYGMLFAYLLKLMKLKYSSARQITHANCPEPTLMQRRNFPRIPIRTEATIITTDGSTTCMGENISIGGLFVRMDKRIEMGTETSITVPLPSPVINNIIVLNGIAVRIEDGGVAFKFQNVGHDAFRYLASFIDYST